MKLTKVQAKNHAEALRLVDLERPLNEDEKRFVLDNYHEGATHVNGSAGAFFTPHGLARDFAIEVDGGSADGACIDLCAGIGALAFAVEHKVGSLVCVEINPDYAKVGRKIVPDAQWIEADVFSPELLKLGRFGWAISNPPFGRIKAPNYSGSFKGSDFEYKVIDAASRLADFGAFIIPQNSAPFRLSGQQSYADDESDKARRFREQTGIQMEPGFGIDTAHYKADWNGVSPICEIVVCEFERARSGQPDMFDEAA